MCVYIYIYYCSAAHPRELTQTLSNVESDRLIIMDRRQNHLSYRYNNTIRGKIIKTRFF